MKLLKNRSVIAGAGLMLIGLIVILVCVLKPSSRELARPEFEQLLQANQINQGHVTPTPYAGIYLIEGTRQRNGRPEKFYITTHLDEPQIKSLFAQSSVKVEIPGQGMRAQWVNIVSTAVIAGLVIMLVVYQTSLGKGKDKRVRERPSVRFLDVAGIEEAKSEVQEIVDFLRDPKKYQRLGGNLPKGVLLIGPPGTGKTMLAKAIACEGNAQFFSAHGSDFTEVFVGVGASASGNFSGRRERTSRRSFSSMRLIAWARTASSTRMASISRQSTRCWPQWTDLKAVRELL